MKLICNHDCPSTKTVKGNGWSVISGMLVLVMPKCALCWAAYMNLLGFSGWISTGYRSWFLPVTIILFGLTLGKLLYGALYHKNFIAFGMALTGGFLIFFERYHATALAFRYLAMFLLISAIFLEKRITYVYRSQNNLVNK